MQKCLVSLYPNMPESTISTEIKIVCQKKSCQAGNLNHYLSSKPESSLSYKRDCIMVVCGTKEEDLQPITLGEAYWYKNIGEYNLTVELTCIVHTCM